MCISCRLPPETFLFNTHLKFLSSLSSVLSHDEAEVNEHKERSRRTWSDEGCGFWLFPPAGVAPCSLLLVFVGLAVDSRGLFLSTARTRRVLSVRVAGRTFNMVSTHTKRSFSPLAKRLTCHSRVITKTKKTTHTHSFHQ